MSNKKNTKQEKNNVILRRKPILAGLLAVLLIISNVFPALLLSAEESEEPVGVGLQTELIEEGPQAGLYITLENAPTDLAMVEVQYSYGGINYMEWDGKLWEGESCRVDEDGNLTLLCYTPDEYPLAAYLSEAINSLYIKVRYDTKDFESSGELEPVRFSHENTYEINEIPPLFSADFKMGWFSYSIMGHFKEFPPNVAQVCNTYSWDGVNYQYTNPEWPIKWNLMNLGKPDSQARDWLENQEVVQHYEEPLLSFLAGEQNAFYLRLEITTEDHEVYYSQPAYISRSARQPLPENLTPRVSLGFDLSVMEIKNESGSVGEDDYYAERHTHGEYQMTVPADAMPQDIMGLLPETVPIRIRLWDKYTKEQYTFGDLPCAVKWKPLPSFSLTPGEPYVIENVAERLEIPAGTDVTGALGIYTLGSPLTFKSRFDSDVIHLVLNPVSPEDDPKVALRGYNYELIDENGNDGNEVRDDQPMSLAFWNKPSGASSIKAYSVVDGVRTEICDLLDRRDINHNQSHALYGYIDLLQPDEYPFREYLNGELDSFSVELEIEGGVYAGKKVVLPWPMEYEAPEEIFDPYGFDGQENNAGSGYEEIEEGSSENGGLPPWFPPEEAVPPSSEPEKSQQTGADSQTIFSGGSESTASSPVSPGKSQETLSQGVKKVPSFASEKQTEESLEAQSAPQLEGEIKNKEAKNPPSATTLSLVLKVVLVCIGTVAAIVISGIKKRKY